MTIPTRSWRLLDGVRTHRTTANPAHPSPQECPMKHLITTTALALALTVALTGCSGAAVGESEPDTAPSTSGSSALEEVIADSASDPDGNETVKDIGREALREQQPVLTAAQSDADIDEMAEAACEAFDVGVTPEALVLGAMKDGLEGEAGSIMALAAYAYCPEHKDMIDDFSDSN